MRFITVALLLLLAAVQAELWLGDGGIPAVMRQQARLDAKQQANAELRRANLRLTAEVEDLRQGLEMVEERARGDLGMVRPDEILVQYAPRR
ncbi:MAG: septum formation initiator family protein [Aquabacterium sp.]|nr:septum formation initiator family protein [Aquabacterium sp.]